MSAGQINALRRITNSDHGLSIPGYLLLQAVVLILWWPKSSLFERIDLTGEPTTLAAVVIFSGAALAYLAIQLGLEPATDEIKVSPASLPAEHGETVVPVWKILTEYCRIHFIQLGYLMALFTPLILVAHSIASVSATNLLWIAAITAVHTTFYRLLSSWLRLCWAEREQLFVAIVARVVLVAIYLCTTMYVADLSHISMSLQLAQPSDGAARSMATIVLPFIVTYAALSALLCIGLLRQLAFRGAISSSETDP